MTETLFQKIKSTTQDCSLQVTDTVPPEQSLASYEEILPFLLLLMVSDWFSGANCLWCIQYNLLTFAGLERATHCLLLV